MTDAKRTKADLLAELEELREEITRLSSERPAMRPWSQQLIDHAGDGWFLHDREGKIVDVNQRACESLGYAREELLKLHVSDFDPLWSKEAITDLSRGMQPDQPIRLETIHRRKDGVEFPVEVNLNLFEADGRPLMVGTARNLSERRRAEHAERRLSLQAKLLDSVRESVIVTDVDGLVTFWGKGSEALYGYRAAEVLGKPITFIVEPGHEAEEEARLRHVIEHGSWGGEYRQRRKDGTPFWADTFLSLVTDDDGTPRALVGIDRDISERKKAEEELRASQERLRNLAARLLEVREEERTVIAREIHDGFGQTLSALKMDMVWLEDRLPKDRDELIRHTRGMVALIDGTLDTVRDLSLRIRPAILDDLGLEAAVEWEVRNFSRRTGVKCTLVMEETESGAANGSDTAVFRILQEALSNVARHAGANRVKVQLQETPTAVILEVSDDGRGISAGEIADSRSLGLIGMRERAGALGGSVEVAPGKTVGTVVTLSMPRASCGRKSGG